MKQIRRIAIIGFGSAGAAASLALKRSGFDVEIFERASRIGPVGAGILLHPSGQAVLEKLGLRDRMVTASECIESIHVVTRKGKTILDIRYDETHAGRSAYGVERSLLFALLEDAVRNAAIPLHLGKEILSLDRSDIGTRCRTADNNDSGLFDLVILCDGARSALRKSVVPWSRTWSYSHGARWVIGECARVKGRLHQVVDGTNHLVGILPTGHNRASFFWGTSPNEDRTNFPAWKEHALDLCPEASELVSPLSSFGDFLETKYFHLFAGACNSPSTVLLGDSWHAMSPHLGQGTNLALLDGYIFAHALTSRQGDLEEARKYFRSARRGNNLFYQTLSFSFSSFFQSNGILKGKLRDTFLPLISKSPYIRRQMVSSISGMRCRFFGCKDLSIP